jgi:hypothetical protein
MDKAKKELLKKRLADGYQYIEKKLGLKNRPKIILKEDIKNAEDEFGLTGFFNPDNNSISLYITDRHPTDICRTMFHEIIHQFQHQNGKFDNVDGAGAGYAQNDPHLRKMEQQAYLVGNMMYRDFQDLKRKERQQ